MTGLRRHLDLIADGSTALCRAFGEWLLPGEWRPALARLGGSCLGAWIGGAMFVAAPPLTAVAVTWWCAAAWRRGRAATREAAAEAAMVELLRDCIGEHRGALLSDVLAVLHRERLHLDWDVSALRAVVTDRLGLRVSPSVRVGERVSVGVYLDDLLDVWDVQPTPPPAPSGDPSPKGVTSDNYTTTAQTRAIVEGVAWSIQPSARGEVNDQ